MNLADHIDLPRDWSRFRHAIHFGDELFARSWDRSEGDVFPGTIPWELIVQFEHEVDQLIIFDEDGIHLHKNYEMSFLLASTRVDNDGPIRRELEKEIDRIIFCSPHFGRYADSPLNVH